LLAKLEALPARAAHPKPVRPKPRPKPAPVEPIAAPVSVEPAPPALDELSETGNSAAVPSATEIAPVIATETSPPEAIAPAHPLPKHAQLKFNVYQGSSFKIGEATHRLEVDENNHYTLSATVRATGVVGLLKKFNLDQTSHGDYSARGLIPSEFIEVKDTSSGLETQRAEFNWSEQQLKFSSGTSVALPPLSQDFLSFLYQLSQLDVTQDALSLSISNGKKLERYRLDIGDAQEIDSRMGKIMAIPFRKIHAPHEEGLEVWLGVAYRLLPVKISQLNRDGKIMGEMVVSEIRLSDE
ncbi:MAG: DUF3108 domain-containing protein, partial [Sideroxydans sp.]|nr:DUF3108 domain-containing protein [Sideroxydans sp.]